MGEKGESKLLHLSQTLPVLVFNGSEEVRG